jgi:predicted dehydrogenase
VESLSEYAQEMEAFADYVAGVSVGPTTGESERRSLAIVQAGYESAQSGQPVNLRRRFGNL